MSGVKLQTAVTKQLPEFIREDYLTFTAFIEAYYEYLESVDARNIEDLRNIDNTVYEYLIYINNETGFLNFTDLTLANINPRIFLRKTKQAFIAKGTEESYKFLFRLLFKKPVEINYPWEQVLKTSDGKWKQDTSLFVHVDTGNVLNAIGNRVTILGTNTNIKIYVDGAVNIRDNIYELFIDKNFYGTLSIGDKVSFEGFSGTIIPTTERYSIDYAGSGYKVGDLITNTFAIGSITIEQILKVTKVDTTIVDPVTGRINGGIQSVSTVKFGCGYASTFTINAFKNIPALINSRLTISRTTSGNTSVKYDSKENSRITSYTESGTIINDDAIEGGYAGPFYAGTLLNSFTNGTDNTVDMTTVAVIRCHIGAVARYQGYYISTDGFLDDDIRLQDSKYYQKYSYVLKADERLVDYKSYIKSFVHAAGLALFSEYQIQNTYVPGIDAAFYYDEYISKATFITKEKALQDYASISGLGGIIKKNAYDEGSYFSNTYNPPTASTTTFTG
jgi:hypothetical protein